MPCMRLMTACVVLLCAAEVQAERAWVKDEVRINVRTGPGTQYRILGVLKTGDSVQVLAREESWTQIQPSGKESGWIPTGYLAVHAPARIALAKREAEVAELREQLGKITESEATLRTKNDELSGADGEQREVITRLTRENLELKAGARWPEWITGACIIGTGMLLGAVLQRSMGRRRAPRIKL